MTTKEMVEAIENILQSDLNLSHGTNQALTQAIKMIKRIDEDKISRILIPAGLVGSNFARESAKEVAKEVANIVVRYLEGKE